MTRYRPYWFDERTVEILVIINNTDLGSTLLRVTNNSLGIFVYRSWNQTTKVRTSTPKYMTSCLLSYVVETPNNHLNQTKSPMDLKNGKMFQTSSSLPNSETVKEFKGNQVSDE